MANVIEYEPYDSGIVKQGVASDLINRNRYESYLRIIGNLLNDDKNKSWMN